MTRLTAPDDSGMLPLFCSLWELRLTTIVLFKSSYRKLFVRSKGMCLTCIHCNPLSYARRTCQWPRALAWLWHGCTGGCQWWPDHTLGPGDSQVSHPQNSFLFPNSCIEWLSPLYINQQYQRSKIDFIFLSYFNYNFSIMKKKFLNVLTRLLLATLHSFLKSLSYKKYILWKNFNQQHQGDHNICALENEIILTLELKRKLFQKYLEDFKIIFSLEKREHKLLERLLIPNVEV